MVNKGSSFADFVRFRPHTHAHTQQSLPPLWAAINFYYEKLLLKDAIESCFIKIREKRRITYWYPVF